MMNNKIFGVLIAFVLLAVHCVESKRLSVSYNMQSLPMMISNHCGFYDGKKELLAVHLVGNWAKMDLNKEKCEESKELKYRLCMVGPLCRVDHIAGGKKESIECNPQGNAGPDPTGHGMVTTYSCYKQHDVDYI